MALLSVLNAFLSVPFAHVPDRFRFAADVPKAGGEQREEKSLVQVVPEQFEKACVEVDPQERDPESFRDVVVVPQAVIDGPAGNRAKQD